MGPGHEARGEAVEDRAGRAASNQLDEIACVFSHICVFARARCQAEKQGHLNGSVQMRSGLLLCRKAGSLA